MMMTITVMIMVMMMTMIMMRLVANCDIFWDAHAGECVAGEWKSAYPCAAKGCCVSRGVSRGVCE